MRFDLLTEFELAAPRLAAYQAIRDVKAWPQWWRGCLAVRELAPGDERGLGARQRILWRSRLPYKVAIEVETVGIVRGERIQARSCGDLDGNGTWTFADVAGGVALRYHWQVVLQRAWMRRAAPFLAPLFRINHNWLMNAGAAGLARHLGVAAPRVRHSVIVPAASAHA
jgi:uncharacterized protein YndB with AHSA1/START domain